MKLIKHLLTICLLGLNLNLHTALLRQGYHPQQSVVGPGYEGQACMQIGKEQEKGKQAAAQTVARDTGFLDTIIPVPELQKIIKDYYIDPKEYSFAPYFVTMLPKMVDEYRCSVAISPDGKTVVTGCSSGEIKIWQDGACKVSCDRSFMFFIDQVAMAHDGTIAAINAFTSNMTLHKPDGTLVTFDIGAPNIHQRMVIKKDGTIVTTSGNTIKIWKNAALQKTLTAPGLNEITNIFVNENDEIFVIDHVIGLQSNQLYLFPDNNTPGHKFNNNFNNQFPLQNLRLYGIYVQLYKEICSVPGYSPRDDKFIVARNNTIVRSMGHYAQVIKNNEIVHVLSGHTRPIVALGAHNDVIITASKDNSIKIWNDGICIATLPFEYPDKHNVVILKDHFGRSYQAPSGKILTNIAVADNGTFVIRCNASGSTCIWKPTPHVLASLNNLSLEQLAMLQKLLPQLRALRLQQPQGELKLSDEQLTLYSKLHLPPALQQQMNQFYQTNFEQQRKDRIDQLHKQEQEQQALHLKLQQEAAALAEAESKQRAAQAGKKENCCIQ